MYDISNLVCLHSRVSVVQCVLFQQEEETSGCWWTVYWNV